VGDAASSYDPISSQGIHKALAEGLQVANVIIAYLGGDADRLQDYQSSVIASFDNYLQIRNYFYGLEIRWPDSAFWKRRQARTVIEDQSTVNYESHLNLSSIKSLEIDFR